MRLRILFLSFLVVFFASQVCAETIVNRIVAVVNGEIITLYDLRAAAGPMLKRAGVSSRNAADKEKIDTILAGALEDMITHMIFVQEAERNNIPVKESEVENEIQKMVKRSGLTLEQIETKLVADGSSLEEYRKRIRSSILRSRLLNYMVGGKVVVAPEEIAAYYEEHKSDFSGDRKIGLKLLVVAPGVDAEALRVSILDGTLSFEDAVAQHSIGPGKDSGGNLGELVWMDVSPEWREALDGLAPGEITSLLSIQGYQGVLQVASVTDGNTLPLEEVSTRIEQILRKPRLEERFDDYSAKLREKAVVDNRL